MKSEKNKKWVFVFFAFVFAIMIFPTIFYRENHKAFKNLRAEDVIYIEFSPEPHSKISTISKSIRITSKREINSILSSWSGHFLENLNHPKTIWHINLFIKTKTIDIYGEVSKFSKQGTHFTLLSGGKGSTFRISYPCDNNTYFEKIRLSNSQ